MVFLGFTCVFLGIVIAIMILMALGARGIAKEKQKEAEAAQKEDEK